MFRLHVDDALPASVSRVRYKVGVSLTFEHLIHGRPFEAVGDSDMYAFVHRDEFSALGEAS